MAVVDILISKTFDASVICPAEQTCVDRRRDLRRRRRRVPAHGRPACSTDDEVDAPRASSRSTPRRARSTSRALGPVRASTSAALAGIRGRRRRRRCCSRRCRPTSTSSPRTRSSQEKLMPVLGLVRSPSVEHGDRRLRAGHRARRARATPRPSTRATRTVIDALRRSRCAPGASSSTRRPRSARSAASTTR